MIEYRKSGLSLNHIQGCPLDCAYCIRHTYGLWDQRVPRALMADAQAVDELVGHRYFQPHVTPLQLFNRATDPFLPVVRPHTFAVLEDLDARGLRNHVLVITRHQMKPSDVDRLNTLQSLKVTLLFTYSGIDDKRIEPYPSSEVIAQRLHERGAHNRFQLSPESSTHEVGFYREATERLIRAGYSVLSLDVNCKPPEQSAALICERLMTLLAIRRM